MLAPLSRLAARSVSLLALGGLLVASWALAAGRSAGVRSWEGGPLHELGTRLSGADHRTALIALGACYLVVIACGVGGVLPRHATIVTLVVASVLFAISAVAPRQDLFTYLGLGRLSVVHGISPYDHGLIAAHADPVFQLAVGKWRSGTSPYGPLFTLVTMGVAELPVMAASWVLKGVLSVTMLGCVVLVWLIARELRRDATLAAAFVGLNPAVLVYVLGKGHNDGVMMLPLLLAMLKLVRGREIAAGASVVVATGVKFTAGVMLPILLIATARRRRLAIGVAVGALATVAASYVAFGAGPLHVVHNARRDQGLVHGDFSLFGLIGHGLGLDWHSAAQHWGILAFGALYALALVATLLRPRHWIRWAGWATVALLVTSISLWPWYLAWLLPIAALAGDIALPVAALALTAVSIGLQF